MSTRIAQLLNPFVLLFMATALVGSQTAYAADLAMQKLALLVGALILYVVIASLPPRSLPRLMMWVGLISVFAVLHFWVTHDWVARPVKFAPFNEIGLAWQAIRPITPFPPTFNEDTQGGLAATFLPFLLFQMRTQRQRVVQLLFGMLATLVLVTIILISARGVWLALIIWGVIWLIGSRTQFGRTIRLPHYFGLVITLLAVGGLIILLFGSQIATSLNFVSRLGLLASTVHLIEDFPLIGGGLGTFRGLYSYYIIVTPHLVLQNAHNLWLDVWVEQGILGSVGLIGIYATAFLQLYRATLDARIKWVILLCGGIFVTHSQIENLAYGTEYTPLLLLMPALAMMHTPAERTAVKRIWTDSLVLSVTALLLLLLVYPNAWEINRNAIANAQVDLLNYPSGEWDRRSAETWQPMATAWQLTLASDPDNRTAHHRLGLIALQAHRFSDAVTHLEQGVAQTPQHRGIQKNLGYAYAWQGRSVEGLPYLRAAGVNSAELFAYGHWWKEHQREDLTLTAFQLSQEILESR